jgi:hypothetical protein
MELGILADDRRAPADAPFTPELTPLGRELRAVLEARLRGIDLLSSIGEDGIPSSAMKEGEDFYNSVVRDTLTSDPRAATVIRRTILGMHAVRQMLAFLYQVSRQPVVARQFIYDNFFQAPFVRQFLEREGIEEATQEAARHRCPFLLNLLSALGVIETERQNIKIKSLILVPDLVRPYQREPEETSLDRLRAIHAAWPSNSDALPPNDLSIVRELFGAEFLTVRYLFQDAQFIEEL